MDCQEADFLIYSADPTERPEDVSAELADHLAKCADCRDKMLEVRRLDHLLTIKNTEKPPAGYWRELEQNLNSAIAAQNRHAQPVRIFKFRFLKYSAAAALGVLLCGAMFYNYLIAPMKQQLSNYENLLSQHKQNATTGKQSSPLTLISPPHLTPSPNNNQQAIMSAEMKNFKALDSYLEEQVSWVASEGKNVELGLSDTAVKGRKIFVLVELNEKSANGLRKKVAAPTMTIISGQQVDVSLPTEGNPDLRLHLKCRPEWMAGKIHLDFAIRLQEEVGLMSSFVAKNDQMLNLGEFTHGDRRYEVNVSVSGVMENNK